MKINQLNNNPFSFNFDEQGNLTSVDVFSDKTLTRAEQNEIIGKISRICEEIDPVCSFTGVYSINWNVSGRLSCVERKSRVTEHRNEVWKRIYNVDGHYEISNYGRIRNAKKKNQYIRTVYNVRNGYEQVMFRNRGKKVNLYVHRLVAEVFCNRQTIFQQVDHLDGNRRNNTASNLRWVEPIENNYGRGKYFAYKYKPVKMLDKKTNALVEVFLDYVEAARYLGTQPAKIAAVLDPLTPNKSYNNYTFVFL